MSFQEQPVDYGWHLRPEVHLSATAKVALSVVFLMLALALGIDRLLRYVLRKLR